VPCRMSHDRGRQNTEREIDYGGGTGPVRRRPRSAAGHDRERRAAASSAHHVRRGRGPDLHRGGLQAEDDAEPPAAAQHPAEPAGRAARRPLRRRLGRPLVGPRRRPREHRHGRHFPGAPSRHARAPIRAVPAGAPRGAGHRDRGRPLDRLVRQPLRR